MKQVKQMQRKRLAKQRGQAMLEFAVVLPILLLLTLGTVLLTLSYIQKARMNGIAYMGARVAAVRRPNFDAADYSLNQYKLQSRQNWTDEVTVSQPALGGGQVGVRLQKPGERLDVLANLISGQPGQQPQDLVVEMRLPREYKPAGSLRPATHTEVKYQYDGRGLGVVLDALPDFLKPVLDTTQMAEPQGPSLDERDQNISLNPTNKNLEKFYDKRDWMDAFTQNEEAPAGDFAQMRTVYTHFKAIEGGSMLVSYFIELLGPFAAPIKAVLTSISEASATVAEQRFNDLGGNIDSNIRGSVGGAGL